MSEIENSSCVRDIMNVIPVFNIEGWMWVAWVSLRKFDDGMYICSCSVRYESYMCKTKHAFAYYSHFKPLHQTKCCGGVVDNR